MAKKKENNFTLLIVNRKSNTGWLVDDNGNDYDVILPGEKSKAVYDYDKYEFTGKVTIIGKKQDISVDLDKVKFEPFKLGKDLKELIKVGEKEFIGKQEEDSKSGDIPGEKFTVNEDGKLEVIYEKLEENPSKERIKQILEEVGVVSPFKSYTKATIGELRSKFNELRKKDKTLTLGHGPHFLGMHLPAEGKYVVASTPAEEFEDQIPIMFQSLRTAIFVYAALKEHPEFGQQASKIVPFPIERLTVEEDKVKVILVKDGFKFLTNLNEASYGKGGKE